MSMNCNTTIINQPPPETVITRDPVPAEVILSNQGRPGEDGAPGGIEEAPIDGKQYGRQDAAWTEIVGGGGGDGKWEDGVSPGDIHYSSGNVGIGTDDPSQPLDVSGVFNVRADGAVIVGGVQSSVTEANGNGIKPQSWGTLLVFNGGQLGYFASNGFQVKSDAVYQWSSTTAATGTPDVILARDGAGQLALRDGENGQSFHVYNWWNAVDDFERLSLRWDNNNCLIGLQQDGSGSGSRTLLIDTNTQSAFSRNGVEHLHVNQTHLSPAASNSYDLGRTGSKYRNVFVAGYHQIDPSTAPGDTTDKLYNVAGDLYWNGTQLGGGGGGKWEDGVQAGQIHYSGGKVGIGDDNPAHDLTVSGSIGISQFGRLYMNEGEIQNTGVYIKKNSVDLSNTSILQWASGSVGGLKDVILARDGAGQLALRDGANAQAFHVYADYSASDDYERLSIRGGGNYFIDTQSDGAGSKNRILYIRGGQVRVGGWQGGIGGSAPGMVFSDNQCYPENTTYNIGVQNPFQHLRQAGYHQLDPITAPGTTTDRLYNVAGDLYWNGSQLGGGGGGLWTDNGTYISSAKPAEIGGATTPDPTKHALTVRSPTDNVTDGVEILANNETASLTLGWRGVRGTTLDTTFSGQAGVTLQSDSQWTSIVGSGNGVRIAGGPSYHAYFDRDVLALRNGSAEQKLLVYNDYVNDTDYERLFVGFDTNIAYIRTEQDGTGQPRALNFESGDQLNWYIGGSIKLSTNASSISARQNFVSKSGNHDIGAVGSEFSNIYQIGFHQLNPTTAPGDTTDKLYNVAGDLYWNGTQLGGGGGGVSPSDDVIWTGNHTFNNPVVASDSVNVNGAGSSYGVNSLPKNTVAYYAAPTAVNDLLYYAAGSVSGNVFLVADNLSATGNVILQCKNNSIAANAGAEFQMQVQNGAGDAYFSMTVTGVTTAFYGFDNSATELRFGFGSNPSSALAGKSFTIFESTGALVPRSNGLQDLGSVSSAWGNIFGTTVTTGTLDLGVVQLTATTLQAMQAEITKAREVRQLLSDLRNESEHFRNLGNAATVDQIRDYLRDVAATFIAIDDI